MVFTGVTITEDTLLAWVLVGKVLLSIAGLFFVHPEKNKIIINHMMHLEMRVIRLVLQMFLSMWCIYIRRRICIRILIYRVHIRVFAWGFISH